MTRKTSTPAPPPVTPRAPPSADRWQLQEAKARFSEVVRRARVDGPQTVTVHGRDEVVIVAAEDFRRLAPARSGATLVAALQASPHRDVELVSARSAMPVRDVEL